MIWWRRLVRWVQIKRGILCPTCYAELRMVATCGICGRDTLPF